MNGRTVKPPPAAGKRGDAVLCVDKEEVPPVAGLPEVTPTENRALAMSLLQHPSAGLLTRHVAGFYQRGWAMGTGGNFSVVPQRNPLRLIISSSGVDKGHMDPEQHLVVVDDSGAVLEGTGKPSAETGIHLLLARRFPNIGAIYHTHSVWGTVLSRLFGPNRGFAITGYEMLKGLEGVRSHHHQEWVPVLPNAQDIPALCEEIEETLDQHPGLHGFYLEGHGLYTWGVDPFAGRRHIEIFEFLFECVGRGELLARGDRRAAGL